MAPSRPIVRRGWCERAEFAFRVDLQGWQIRSSRGEGRDPAAGTESNSYGSSGMSCRERRRSPHDSSTWLGWRRSSAGRSASRSVEPLFSRVLGPRNNDGSAHLLLSSQEQSSSISPPTPDRLLATLQSVGIKVGIELCWCPWRMPASVEPRASGTLSRLPGPHGKGVRVIRGHGLPVAERKITCRWRRHWRSTARVLHPSGAPWCAG